MKTVLTSCWTAARRAALRFQMRSLENHIDCCDECLECVRDPVAALRIRTSRALSCRELARVRAEYNATFQPGVRKVWAAP